MNSKYFEMVVMVWFCFLEVDDLITTFCFCAGRVILWKITSAVINGKIRDLLRHGTVWLSYTALCFMDYIIHCLFSNLWSLLLIVAVST